MPSEAIGKALADAYNALHDEELTLFPDAHETLDRLKEVGIKLVLITNGAAEPQRAKIVRFALEHRFDHIQIEGEHGFGKPEERAYTHAMDVLGVGPDETWMVGDNLEWEIVAPQRLGIYAICCKSTPDWAPTRIAHKCLVSAMKKTVWWGPSRRPSGRHLQANTGGQIKGLFQIRGGVPFR